MAPTFWLLGWGKEAKAGLGKCLKLCLYPLGKDVAKYSLLKFYELSEHIFDFCRNVVCFLNSSLVTLVKICGKFSPSDEYIAKKIMKDI